MNIEQVSLFTFYKFREILSYLVIKVSFTKNLDKKLGFWATYHDFGYTFLRKCYNFKCIQCSCCSFPIFMSEPVFRFKSLINSLEILHISWLEVRTPYLLLWSISKVGYWIRGLIRDMNRESGTDALAGG